MNEIERAADFSPRGLPKLENAEQLVNAPTEQEIHSVVALSESKRKRPQVLHSLYIRAG